MLTAETEHTTPVKSKTYSDMEDTPTDTNKLKVIASTSPVYVRKTRIYRRPTANDGDMETHLSLGESLLRDLRSLALQEDEQDLQGEIQSIAESIESADPSLAESFLTQSSTGLVGSSEAALDRRLYQRQKQIDYGKNTIGYARYTSLLPVYKRNRQDPVTPDKKSKCSKRAWDGLMGKIKAINTLHQAAFTNNYTSDLSDPSAFDPVLNKISQKSLVMMFENDIALSLKAIKLNSSSNNQKLLNMDLFLTAWKKYGSYLPPLFYATRLIESGEELIQCKGFHNLAASHCFSKLLNISNAEGIQMARLIVRAKYGRTMANYIQILSIDPLVKSPIGGESVEKILSELLVIMCECSKTEGLTGLILTGSYHIRNICNHLMANKNFSLSAEYLSKSLTYLNDCIELSGAEYIPWLVDNVKATYDAFFNLSMIEEANNIVVQTISRIKIIEDLEKEAKYTDILPQEIQQDINAGLYEMSLLLFGCEVRNFASVIYRGSVQNSSYLNLNNSGAESGTLLIPISSISTLKGSKQILKILKGQIDRLCETSTSKSLYQVKLGTCCSLFEENPKFNKDLKNMADSYIKDNSVIIEKLEHTTQEDDNSNLSDASEQVIPGSSRSIKKTGKKEKQEPAEEIKAKKNEFKQLITRLQMFTDDRGKLAAINAALVSLGLNGHSLHTYNKCTEPLLENLIKQMIVFGVFLLVSPAESLDGHVTMKKMIEVKKGKLIETNNLPNCLNLERFDFDDVINFSRYLYVQEYWGHFSKISTNKDILQHTRFSCYQNEIALRSRCIKADVSFHADRMVGFDYSHGEISKSLLDLRKRRQKVGKFVECSIISFTKEVSLCLTDAISRSKNLSLLTDASYILWKYVEPYFIELDEANPEKALVFEDIVMVTAYAAYIISSQIYNPSNLFVTISTSYARYLEANNHYKESIDVLLSAIKHLEQLQTRLGENGTPFINSLLEEKSVDPLKQGKMLVKLLACDHVDLLMSYYRCYIKLHHQKTLEDVKNREEQHFRLTQKKIKIDPSFRESDLDQFMKQICGESHSHRAIFLLVFSSHALHYNSSIRKRCIVLSYKNLQQAVEYEKYLQTISTSKEDTHLSLVFRTHDGVVVRVSSPANGSFARLFCNLSAINKMVTIKKTKFAGSGESVTLGSNREVIIFISGLEKYTLYEISGGLEDSNGNSITQLPRVNFVTGNMLPLILCWEYFCLTAPRLGYLNLGLNGLKFLWSYFVVPVFTDKSLVNNVLPKEPAPLKEEHIARESPGLILNFIKVILYLNEEEFQPILKSYLENVTDSSLYHSLNSFRFRAVERLLVALTLSKVTENRKLELQSAIKCFSHTESIIKTNSGNVVAVPTLSLVHSSMMRSISTLKNNRTQGIVEYLIPTTTYLLKLFTNLKMYDQILKTCSEVLDIIHRYCVINDPKIKNVLDDRFSRTGVAPDSNLRNLYNSQEFIHHEYLATTDRWSCGYNLKKTELDDFCEYLESQVVTSCYKLPLYLENSLVSDTLKKELSRRSLDSQTTMKEIQIMFSNCQSPDLVFHEVLKFRKHSRFVEIVSKIANWAISIGIFDQASKICGEVEDWCSKRNLILTTIDLTFEEAQKWEAVMKKKKILVKGEKKPDTEATSEKRGRSTKPSSSHSPAPRKNNHKKNMGKTRNDTGDRDSEGSSRERSERSVSPDLNSSQKSQPSTRRLSYSGKKIEESASIDNETKSNYIAYRRRKLNQKQHYYEGLTQEMKMKTEKAAKVLDRKMTALWYKSRMRRRLNLILITEAPHRVDVSFLHAESMIGLLKRELAQKGLVKKESLDIDAFFISEISTRENCFPTNILNSIRDIFQYFSTGIKLAARYGLWSKLLSGIHQMLDAYKHFVEVGAFDASIIKERVSAVFYQAADDIADCFQTATFVVENSLKPFVSSLEHLSAPDCSRRFPAQRRDDIFDNSWNIMYKDVHGIIHSETIHLDFIIRFLKLTLKIMYQANMNDRRNLLLKRLNDIFSGSEIFLDFKGSSKNANRSSYKLLNAARNAASQDRISLYQKTLVKAEEEGSFSNQLVSLNELANISYDESDLRGAATNWMKCINLVFGEHNILLNWPSIFSFDAKSDRIPEIFKVSIEILQVTRNSKLSIFMGLIISKLAHYCYSKNEGFQNHIILFAVSCLLAPFAIIPPRASKYVDFFTYESASVREILDNVSSKYGYQPGLILNELLWLITHFISSKIPYLVPPIVCFINHISECANFSNVYRTIAQCAQIEALQLLNMPEHAYAAILSIKGGIESNGLSFTETFTSSGSISDFLELSASEIGKGIYTQELLSIVKTKFLIDSWLSKYRPQSGISDVKSFVLERQKRLYSQKFQITGMDRLFYDGAEIWWYILLGDLCFLENNVGISIKFYFTAMEGLQSYASGCKKLGPIEYGFLGISHLRFLIFEKTIVAFIALKYFDVAHHIARTARKESESFGMKLQSIIFHSLETTSSGINISPVLPEDNELVPYMHMHNFEMISEAFEAMISGAFDSLSDRNYNHDPFLELDSIAKRFPYLKEDLLRIKINHFLLARLKSNLQSIQPLFVEIQDLYASCTYSEQLSRNFTLIKTKNMIELAQYQKKSDLGIFLQAKQAMVDFVTNSSTKNGFSYGRIRESFLILASIEILQGGQPMKWLYLATKITMLRNHRKRQKKLCFDLDINNLTKGILYDLELFNYKNQVSSNGHNLPYPLETDTLENVLKFSDPLLAIPEIKVSNEDIFEIVTTLEDELLNPYKPLNDPWRKACQDRLTQILSLSDSDYKWNLEPRNFENPVPSNMYCIQWLETRHPLDSLILDQSNLYKLYFCVSDQQIFSSRSLISKNLLESLVQKSESVVLALKRSSQIPDENFLKKATENWIILLDKFISFFCEKTTISHKYLEPKIPFVECLMKSLDINQGYGYGADLNGLSADPESSKIFFEWILDAISE